MERLKIILAYAFVMAILLLGTAISYAIYLAVARYIIK